MCWLRVSEECGLNSIERFPRLIRAYSVVCLQACRNNLVQHLDHLLFYGADMNARNASGNTPLHVCAVNNTDASCIRQLLFRGAQKDALNYANQTPYQVAVIAGNMELAEVIKNYQSEEVGELWTSHEM